MAKSLRWIALLVVGALAVAAYMFWPRGYCRSAHSKYDLKLPTCPSGKLRQTVRIRGNDLRRNGDGKVHLKATGLYTIAKSDAWQYVELTDIDATLALVDAAGQETPIALKDGWKTEFDEVMAKITLPQVHDGDYKLRAHVMTNVGAIDVDLPLALYAPARIHVLTDRPLYEPGNEVAFRALVVRARDLTPIDKRPGTWIVRDPSGEVLLEEKAPAGEWGVVSGNFPLDSQAATGMWSVTWQSGTDQETTRFQVEPFTLPRFRVQASPDRPYYRSGETPSVTGSVVYSSGAPVIGATVHLTWQSIGPWPPPNEWMRGGLPKQVTTDPSGSFSFDMLPIPNDLLGQATLIARLSAVDPAGDRVEGSVSVLLSKDAIKVQAVTELGEGLVQNANNRVYLRVTTADGQKLAGAKINVKPAWSPDQPGFDAVLDADGVARLQLDPGPPVNVVVPAMPVRKQASSPGQLVRRFKAEEMVSQDSASLADQVQMDKWLKPLEPCAKWTDGTQNAMLGIQVNEAGTVVSGVSGESSIERCTLAVVRKQRLPRGPARLYALGFQFKEAPLPTLEVSYEDPLGNAPDGLDDLFSLAALDARDCLPRDVDAELPWVLSWQVAKGQKTLKLAWLRIAGEVPMPPRAAECIRSRIARYPLNEEADADSMGVAHMSLSSGTAPEQRRIGPQPTIMKGYELAVSAVVEDRPFGETTLRMRPGAVPPIRVRATPVLAKPGEDVSFKLIRGPSFKGELPEKISLYHFGDTQKLALDPKTRTATYKLPDDAEGWYRVDALGGRALVYVRSDSQLSVGVSPEKPRYAPGATAKLNIQTRVGSKGAKAAVGLFGVDESLGQLTTLADADELAHLRPKVEMYNQAFGVLDAGALTVGRIRGAFAAEATILRVNTIPFPAQIDVVLSGSAETPFEPILELTDRFYIALTELHTQARQWETSAPNDEQMTPKRMATLWDDALDALEDRGQSVEDAFGRRLRLHRLPSDLLALTDPRQVVVVGTRLPEDVENWSQWVEENTP